MMNEMFGLVQLVRVKPNSLEFLQEEYEKYLKGLKPLDFILVVFEDKNAFHDINLKLNTGFDLSNKELVELHSRTKVETGVKWLAPYGYVMHIVPRSGISYKTPIKLLNAPATIEAEYRGDISLLLGVDKDYLDEFESYKDIIKWMNSISIPSRTRLAQAIIQKTPLTNIQIRYFYYMIDDYVYEDFANLFPSERSDKGFGSTGTK